MDSPGLFTRVNDSIRSLAHEAPSGQTWEFFCECPNVACHELVSLTLLEFDTRRTASQPVLAMEHVPEA